MGHRANFVVVKDGKASAYFDQWAALGCVYALSDGPDSAAKAAEETEPTDELLDWAFAEGGYLIDFDEKSVLVFGPLEDDYAEEFEDSDEVGEDEDEEGDDDEESELGSSRDGFQTYFESIAPNWGGWRLRWDDRGTDAFAMHLERRGIRTIKTQSPSHPEDSESLEFVA